MHRSVLLRIRANNTQHATANAVVVSCSSTTTSVALALARVPPAEHRHRRARGKQQQQRDWRKAARLSGKGCRVAAFVHCRLTECVGVIRARRRALSHKAKNDLLRAIYYLLLTPSHEAKSFVLSGACGAATTRQFIMSSSSRMTCRRQRSRRSCISVE
eukprot:scaffold24159_cov68-Phaeocystis_antarctica.AAC.10